MSTAKKGFLITLLVTSCALLGGIYLLLSGSTFLADLVFGRVYAAFYDAGRYELYIDRLSGNPITGVSGEGISIVHQGVPLASADWIEMKLSLPTILTSSPKLARMTFQNLRASVEDIQKHLPEETGEPAGPPALDRLVLEDSTIATPWGDVEIARVVLTLGGDGYRLQYRGRFLERDTEIQAETINAGGGMRLAELHAEWGGILLRAKGDLSPRLSVDIEVEDLDVGKLAEVVPDLKEAPIDGIYSGVFNVENAKAPIVRGRFVSRGGNLWHFPYTSLSADVAYEGAVAELKNLDAALLGAEVRGDVKLRLVSGDVPELSTKLRILSLDTATLQQELPWLAEIKGRVDSIACDISGPLDALSGAVSLRADRMDIYDFNCTAVSADLKLHKSAQVDVALRGNILGSTTMGRGTVQLAPTVVLDLAVDIFPFSLAALGAKFPQVKEYGVSGTGKGFATVKGPVENLVVTGGASFQSLMVSRDYTLEDVRGEFVYSNEALSLKEVRASWNGAVVTAEGDHRKNLLSADQRLDFKGTLSNVAIQHFANFFPAIAEYHVNGVIGGKWNVTGDTSDPIVHFDLNAPNPSVYKGISLDRASVSGIYRGNEIKFERLDLRRGKSDVDGTGLLRLSPLSFEVEGRFREIDPAEFAKMGLTDLEVSGDIDGTMRFWMPPGGKPSVSVRFADSTLSYGSVYMSKLNGGVTYQDGDVTFEDFDSQVNFGRIQLDGTIANLAALAENSADVSIDVFAQVTSADIGRISRLFMPSIRGYQGFLVGSGDIRGTAANPSFEGNAALLGLRTFGFFFPFVRMENIAASQAEIKLPKILAIAGRGRIDAAVTLSHSNEEWHGDIEATGKSVDLRSLLTPLNEQLQKSVAGTLNFDFQGSGTPSAFEGHGTARIPDLKAMGLCVTEIEAPFWVSEGYVMVEHSMAKAYDGGIQAQFAKDLVRSDWGGRIQVNSADLSPMLKDLMPDSEGTIEGIATLKLRFGGDTTRTSLSDGDGSLEIANGEVIGYPGAAAVSELIGGRPLRFDSLLGTFNLGGNTLYILPGSRVSAPKGDPVFKYVMVDGSVSTERDIHLSCMGNINIRALNTFAGGVQGLLTSAMDHPGEWDTNALLNDFLGGAISGFSRNEFRDVSLNVNGTSSDIRFENIKVAAPTKYDVLPAELQNPTNGSNIKGRTEERLNLKLEFPVGPGGGDRSDSVRQQVGGQVLEQALKGIFSF